MERKEGGRERWIEREIESERDRQTGTGKRRGEVELGAIERYIGRREGH